MKSIAALSSLVVAATLSGSVWGASYDVSIRGTDAIWLAGRTDLVIPPYTGTDVPGWPIDRHDFGTPERLAETAPPVIPVTGGDVVKVFDPAVGGVSFFNGFGAPLYGPEGNAPTSSILSLGGISAYLGTQGALVGVFLNNTIPDAAPAPVALDFQSAASRDFTSLSPGLGQIFFIGDGENSANILQEFVAPAGATRLFLGVPDGFGFLGAPGAYDDNDGSYRIRVGVNQNPVPEAGTSVASLLLTSLAGGAWLRRRKA